MGLLVPKLMEKHPTPEGVLEFIACRCKKGCNARHSCRRVGLSCKAIYACENEFSDFQENDEDEELVVLCSI